VILTKKDNINLKINISKCSIFFHVFLSLDAEEILGKNYCDFCELTCECGVSLFLTLAAVECGGVVTHLLQALRQHVRSLNTTTDDFQRDIGSSPEGVIPLLTLTCQSQVTTLYKPTANQLQSNFQSLPVHATIM
jgi:hypothetical protein